MQSYKCSYAYVATTYGAHYNPASLLALQYFTGPTHNES